MFGEEDLEVPPKKRTVVRKMVVRPMVGSQFRLTDLSAICKVCCNKENQVCF